MSFNIKCDDKIMTGIRSWESRKKSLLLQIAEENPDIIGIQEARPNQYEFLKEGLEERFDSIFESRDEDAPNGEGVPIFFKREKFEMQKFGTFWLSETPNIKASKSWNSRWPRICTYAVLKDKKLGKIFAFFNTHMDHKSEDARIGGAKLILSEIEKLNLPTILTGDFNSTKQGGAFVVLSSSISTAGDSEKSELTTCTDWNPADKRGGYIIDYIFHTKDFKSKDYRVFNDFEDKILTSDHYAIMAEIF